jgi:hypothetical protein
MQRLADREGGILRAIDAAQRTAHALEDRSARAIA